MKRMHWVAVTTVGLTIAGGGFLLGQANRTASQVPSLFVMMYTPGAAWDAALPPNEQLHFGEHSANLARLRADSVIVAGGRFGPWGLIIVEADDEAAARELFASDPALTSGTFEGEVYEWTTIYDGVVPPRR